MTDFGDRILVFIIFATGLAGLLSWVLGSLFEPVGTTERYLGYAGLMVLYFLILVGLWQLLKRIDTQADSEHARESR